ncbi:MAG: hypothetical protein LBF62_08890 [Tannerellaceae bacterium]|jgi:hypothetical protein|nr:hypothetical protein [Tannerellaceae bacterium]
MKTSCYFIVFLLSPAFCLFPAAQEKTEYKELSLHDPYAYSTAEKMYAVADTLPYSSKAAFIINDITKSINNGTLVENSVVWNNLQKLEPYRMHPDVQEAVGNWVEKTVAKIKKQQSKITPLKSLKLIGSYYTSGNFNRVVEESRKELANDCLNPDLRNNMALALIHLNQDLCAQVELEILTKLYDSYPAGLINLTVVYERLNRSDDAGKVAMNLHKSLLDREIDIPQVRFNSAWVENKRGDFEAAEYILDHPKPLKDKKITKFDSLRILNIRQFDQELNKE